MSITAANPAFERMVGASVVQHPIGDYLTPASAKKLEREIARAGTTAESEGYRLEIRTPTGTRAHMFHLLRDDGSDRLLALGVGEVPDQSAGEAKQDADRTALRLARALQEIEEKLMENQELSLQLQERNREVEARSQELFAMTEQLHQHQAEMLRLNQRLERRTRELQVALSGRNRLYGSMSHELRTPVNAVMGYNDLLLAGVYGNLNEQQELAVERSQKAVHHLRELINDILDIARIETGRMSVQPEEVNLSELLADALATVEPIARSEGVEIHVSVSSELGRITTDPRRLRQALVNLIAHAIRNSGKRPVWVRGEQMPGGNISIDIFDNGVGIDSEQLASVFDEFPSLSEDVSSGTGLGLAVASQLVHLLGGELRASSTRGVGTTFHMSLPRVLKTPEGTTQTAGRPE